MTRMKRRIRRRESGRPLSRCTTLDRSASSLPSDTRKSDRRRRRRRLFLRLPTSSRASLLTGLLIISNILIRHGASAACPTAFFAQAISQNKLATMHFYQTKTGVPSAAQCANHCALSASCRAAVYNHDAQSCALAGEDLVECRLFKQRYNTFHLTTDGAQSLSVLGCIDPCGPLPNIMAPLKNMTDAEQIKNVRKENSGNDVRTSMETKQKFAFIHHQTPIVPMLFSHDAIAADGLTFSEKSREPTKTLNFRLFPSSADRKVRLHPIVPVNSPIYKQLQNNIQQQQNLLKPVIPRQNFASFHASGGSASSVSPQYQEILREIVGNRVRVDSAESALPVYGLPSRLPSGTDDDAQGFLRAIQQLNWIQNHLAGLQVKKARKPDEDENPLPSRKVEFHAGPMQIEEIFRGATNAQDALNSQNAAEVAFKNGERFAEATAVHNSSSSAGSSASVVKTFQSETQSHVHSGGLVALRKPLGNPNDDASPSAALRLQSHQSVTAEVPKQRSQAESQVTEKADEESVSNPALLYPIPEDPIVINGRILTAAEVEELKRRERTTSTTTTTVAPWRPAGLIGEDFGAAGDGDGGPLDHRREPSSSAAEEGDRERGFLNTFVIHGLSSMFNNNSENSSETTNSTMQVGSQTTSTVAAPPTTTALPTGPIVCYRSIQQQALLHATLKSVENVTLDECRCACADTWHIGAGAMPENTEHSTDFCKSLQYDEKTAKCVLNYADHNAKHDLIYNKAVDYYYVSCPVPYLLLTAKRICRSNELSSTTEESITAEANIDITTVAETTTTAIPSSSTTTPLPPPPSATTTTRSITTTKAPTTTKSITTTKEATIPTTTAIETPTTTTVKTTLTATTNTPTTAKITTANATTKPAEPKSTNFSKSTTKASKQLLKTTAAVSTTTDSTTTTTTALKTSTKSPLTLLSIAQTTISAKPTTRFNKVLKMKETSAENGSGNSTSELVAETSVPDQRHHASSTFGNKVVSTKRSESAKLTVLTKSTKPPTTTTTAATTTIKRAANADKTTTNEPTTSSSTVVAVGRPKFMVKNRGCFEVIDGYAMNNTAGGLEHDVSVEECQCFCANSLQSGRYSFQCTSATYYHRERDCILNLANRQISPEIFVENPLQNEADSRITYLGLMCSPLKAISIHANKSLSSNGCQEEEPLTTSTIKSSTTTADITIITTVTTTAAPHTDDCFLELPNYVLEGNALIVETNVTIDECKCYCVDAEERYGVLCQSVQYYFDSRTCMLNRENRITEPDRFVLDTESGVQHSYFDYRCHVEILPDLELILSVYVEQVCRQVIELSTKSLLLGHPAAAKASLLNIDDRSNETLSGKSLDVNSKTGESGRPAFDVNSAHSRPASRNAGPPSSSTAQQSVRTSKTPYVTATTAAATAAPMTVVRFVDEKNNALMTKFDDEFGDTQRYQVRNRLKFVDADGEPPDLFGVITVPPPKASDVGFGVPTNEETFGINTVDYNEYKSDYEESKLTDVLTNSGSVRHRPPNWPAKGQQKPRQLSASSTKTTAPKSTSSAARNRTAIPELEEFDENGSSSSETAKSARKTDTTTQRIPSTTAAPSSADSASASPSPSTASTIAASTLELNTPSTTEKVFPYPAVGPCRFSALYQTVFNGVRLLKRMMVSSPAQCFAACHANRCRSANLIHMEGDLKYCELFGDSIVDFRRTDVLGFDRGAVHFDSIQCEAAPQKEAAES